MVRTPHAPEDVLARERLAPLADEAHEDVELGGGDVDEGAAALHGATGDVDLDVGEDEARIRRTRRRRRRSPERAAHARHELGEAERLRDVIFGAELEAGD